MLNKKVAICDALLVFVFEYCKQLAYDGDSKLLILFIESLQNTASECLNDDLVNKKYKSRNYLYFKKFLLQPGMVM